MFSCKGCGLVDHKLRVPARQHEGIDIRIYMQQLGKWVGEEHERISPKCISLTMTELKIPIKHTDGTEAQFVGQQLE